MKNRRKITYSKGGNSNRIYIECFDEDSEEEFGAFLEFMCKISEDKKVFLKSYGLKPTAIYADAIIASASDLLNFLKQSHYLKNTKIKLIDKSIFDARWVIFYFFDNTISWEDFLMTEKLENLCCENSNLLATVSISDERDLMIETKGDLDTFCNSFLNTLQGLGYKIKNMFLVKKKIEDTKKL